jgi:hypothetical protein
VDTPDTQQAPKTPKTTSQTAAPKGRRRAGAKSVPTQKQTSAPIAPLGGTLSVAAPAPGAAEELVRLAEDRHAQEFTERVRRQRATVSRRRREQAPRNTPPVTTWSNDRGLASSLKSLISRAPDDVRRVGRSTVEMDGETAKKLGLI